MAEHQRRVQHVGPATELDFAAGIGSPLTVGAHSRLRGGQGPEWAVCSLFVRIGQSPGPIVVANESDVEDGFHSSHAFLLVRGAFVHIAAFLSPGAGQHRKIGDRHLGP